MHKKFHDDLLKDYKVMRVNVVLAQLVLLIYSKNWSFFAKSLSLGF